MESGVSECTEHRKEQRKRILKFSHTCEMWMNNFFFVFGAVPMPTNVCVELIALQLQLHSKTSSKLTNMRPTDETYRSELYDGENVHNTRKTRRREEKRVQKHAFNSTFCISCSQRIRKILKVHHLWRVHKKKTFSKLNLISLSFIFVRFSIHKILCVVLCSALYVLNSYESENWKFLQAHLSLSLSLTLQPTLDSRKRKWNSELRIGTRQTKNIFFWWHVIESSLTTLDECSNSKMLISCFLIIISTSRQDRAESKFMRISIFYFFLCLFFCQLHNFCAQLSSLYFFVETSWNCCSRAFFFSSWRRWEQAHSVCNFRKKNLSNTQLMWRLVEYIFTLYDDDDDDVGIWWRPKTAENEWVREGNTEQCNAMQHKKKLLYKNAM